MRHGRWINHDRGQRICTVISGTRSRTRLIYILSAAGLPTVYIVRSILYIYQYTILCYYTTTTTDYYIIYYHQRRVYILKPNNNNILFRYCPDLLACVFTRDRRRPRARLDFAFLRIRFTGSRRGFPSSGACANTNLQP